MNKRALMEVLSSPIAYYVTFARVSGGVTAGVFLSQLFYWTGRGKNPQGWIWKTADEFEAETGLTRAEQETARRNLKARGFIEERLAGVPATLHFRVQLEIIMEAVAQFGENDQTSLAESAKLDSAKLPNLIGENCQTNPETTPEITTETTTALPQPATAIKATPAATTTGAEAPAHSAPTPRKSSEPSPELLPASQDERVLFGLLHEAAQAQGRNGPKRFANPEQARAFRAAVAVLNGKTVDVLKSFMRQGGGALGNAVAYVAGAARKELEARAEKVRMTTPAAAGEYVSADDFFSN